MFATSSRSHSRIAPAICFLFLAVLATATTAFAEPRIEVKPPAFDFGPVAQMQTFTEEMTITNSGDSELVLRDIDTTCGCTAAVLPVTNLAPGQTITIDISFSSKRYEGPQTNYVHLITNDPVEPSLEIPVVADVLVPIYTRPIKKQLGFQACRQGETPSIKMDFETKDIDSLELTASNKHPETFAVEITDGSTPRHKTMTITIKADAPGKYTKDFVTLQTNHPDMPEMKIEVRGTIRADLHSSPTDVRFRYAKRGKELKKTVRVRANIGGVDWKVTKVEIDLPEFEATFEEKIPNVETFVYIEGIPLLSSDQRAIEADGRMTGTLKVYTTMPTMPVLEVPVSYLLRL